MGLEDQTLTLEFAFFLGALHALEPGHGKTAMAAFMLGGRRNAWHALLIGVASALSHSMSVFVIAGLTHVASHLITHGHSHSSHLTMPLEWVSAALILGIGVYLLREAHRGHDEHHLGCGHHRHSAMPAPQTLTFKRAQPVDHSIFLKQPSGAVTSAMTSAQGRGYKVAALLGLGGGLIPCPSAMAAYLSSVASGNTTHAFWTIAIFSVGAATSLSAIGVLLRYAGERFAKLPTSPIRQRILNYARALLICGVGIFYVVSLLGRLR